MRTLVFGLLLAGATAHVAPAQDTTLIAGDRAASAELAKIIDGARANGLPVEPILAKIGYAVHIAHATPPRVVAAARATVARLQEAREALAPNPTPNDITAGGNALSAKVSTKSLRDVRLASGNRPVAVPLGVLTQLVANMVDEEKATKYVTDLIRRGVTAPDRICLVMDVLGRMIRVQNEAFDICWAEMEHPRFMVIDPNDGMIVMLAHGISSLWRSTKHEDRRPDGRTRDAGQFVATSLSKASVRTTTMQPCHSA